LPGDLGRGSALLAFLTLDVRLLNQIDSLDGLGLPVFKYFKIIDCQVVDESVAFKNPRGNLDVDDLDLVLKLLGK